MRCCQHRCWFKTVGLEGGSACGDDDFRKILRFSKKIEICVKILRFSENYNPIFSTFFNFSTSQFNQCWQGHGGSWRLSVGSQNLKFSKGVFVVCVFVFVIVSVFLWVRTCLLITLIRYLGSLKSIRLFFVSQLVKSLVSLGVGDAS